MHPDLRGTCLGIQRRIDIVHLAQPIPTGQVIEPHPHLVAGLDQACLSFEHLTDHPDMLQLADAHQTQARLDEHALTHREIVQYPGLRRGNGDGLADLAGFTQPVDICPRHLQCQ